VEVASLQILGCQKGSRRESRQAEEISGREKRGRV